MGKETNEPKDPGNQVSRKSVDTSDDDDDTNSLPAPRGYKELNIFQKRHTGRIAAACKRNLSGEVIPPVAEHRNKLSNPQQEEQYTRDVSFHYDDVISDGSEDEVLKEEIYLKSLQSVTIEPAKRVRGSIFKMRFVNQLFIRGDNIVMIAYDKDDVINKKDNT